MKQALADALEHRGYASLTAVQEAVTKPELTGLDLLVSAQTGSGKTVGFGLAIAPTLLGEDETFPRAGRPLALILAPTRELALQVKRELDWLYARTGAEIASCVGGMDMRDERRVLARGAHIAVATPGRLRDHLTRGSIDLGGLRAVVLDEADEMLDLGFREDLEFILSEAPEDRQTLMFSATVPRGIVALAKSFQRDAVRVSTTAERSQHADIEYQAMSVAPRDAENAIINVLRYHEAPNALVFGNTRAMVNRLTTRLSNRGFPVVALSGELSQAERTHALQAMRDGRARVCVATDVAARGIDLPNLDLVIHAELPTDHETLLHRSGRTGRAGRKGVSVLIVPPSARGKAERLLGAARLRAEWGGAPSADDVRARDEERMLADPLWQQEISETERETVAKLTDRFTAEQIAAMFLRLQASRQSAPEELSAFDEKPAPRAPFGPSVWVSVSGGRRAGAEPRSLIPMLCKAGGITSQDIGAIRITEQDSFVELRASSAEAFFATIGPSMTVEAGARLARVDNPPEHTRTPRPGPAPKPRPRKPARGPAEMSSSHDPAWGDARPSDSPRPGRYDAGEPDAAPGAPPKRRTRPTDPDGPPQKPGPAGKKPRPRNTEAGAEGRPARPGPRRKT